MPGKVEGAGATWSRIKSTHYTEFINKSQIAHKGKCTLRCLFVLTCPLRVCLLLSETVSRTVPSAELFQPTSWTNHRLNLSSTQLSNSHSQEPEVKLSIQLSVWCTSQKFRVTLDPDIILLLSHMPSRLTYATACSVSINTIMNCSRLLRGLFQTNLPASQGQSCQSSNQHVTTCKSAARLLGTHCVTRPALPAPSPLPCLCSSSACQTLSSPHPRPRPFSQSLALARLSHHRAFAHAVPSAWCTLPLPSSPS